MGGAYQRISVVVSTNHERIVEGRYHSCAYLEIRFLLGGSACRFGRVPVSYAKLFYWVLVLSMADLVPGTHQYLLTVMSVG